MAIDNRGDIECSTPQVLWPKQITSIVADLFNIDSYDVADICFETEIDFEDDTVCYTVEWSEDQAVGVFFTVSATGTAILIIDGCDNDGNPTMDLLPIDTRLQALI